MENRSVSAALVLGLTLALGLVAAGHLIGVNLYRIKAAERYVTVKGLAERNVDADLAIWPLTFSETGNDLVAVQKQLENDRHLIRRFLTHFGFIPEDMTDSPPRITDYYSQGYTGANMPQNRYRAEASITLRSQDVTLVRKAMEAAGDLVKDGIVLADAYSRGTEFLFTGLNTIKPTMIAEATRRIGPEEQVLRRIGELS